MEGLHRPTLPLLPAGVLVRFADGLVDSTAYGCEIAVRHLGPAA